MTVVTSSDSVAVIQKEPVNPADIDSIRSSMENNLQEYKKNEHSDENVEKMVEVAMSESDKEDSAEMMEEINRSLAEMDLDKIVREAMQEAAGAMQVAAASMREASHEVRRAKCDIDRDEIDRDLRDAAREIEQSKREMAEDMRRDMSRDGIDSDVIEASINAAAAGMDVAAGVVSSIDIEGIVSAALSGVEATLDALGEIDFDSSDHDYRYDYDNHQRQIDKMERQKEKLKREQKELKQRMKELERRLEEKEDDKDND